MPRHTDLALPTRGHRKKEKTRRQLVAAGLRVLADKGEALTVSDVAAEADVSNGTADHGPGPALRRSQ
jgi:AcrR family transcriptional regulator